MVAGRDAAKPGEGKNSWLTGTAAWNWYAITQFILGIQPDYDGLVIRPCLSESITSYTIHSSLRESEYTINVLNPDHLQSGTICLSVDGVAIDGDKVIYKPGKHIVEAVIKAKK